MNRVCQRAAINQIALATTTGPGPEAVSALPRRPGSAHAGVGVAHWALGDSLSSESVTRPRAGVRHCWLSDQHLPPPEHHAVEAAAPARLPWPGAADHRCGPRANHQERTLPRRSAGRRWVSSMLRRFSWRGPVSSVRDVGRRRSRSSGGCGEARSETPSAFAASGIACRQSDQRMAN